MNAVTTQESNALVSMGFGSLQSFEFMQRTARMFTESTMVPTAYRAVIQKGYGQNISYEQNPAALSNCVIALNMSLRMNADPLMIMQNLHIIEGRPSWSSQYIIASINSCGRYAPLRFEVTHGQEIDATYTTYEWDNKQKKAVTTKTKVRNDTCIAWTVEKSVALPKFTADDIKLHGSIYRCCKASGVPLLESTMVTMEMAVNEGWYGKNGSKWQTMSDLMLQYRSAAFFGRIYAPELLMGLPSTDEVRDIIDVEPQADGSYAMPAAPVAPVAPASPVSKSETAAAAKAADSVQDVETKQTEAKPEPKADPAPQPTAATKADKATGELPAGVVITANQVKYLQTKIKALELPETAVAAMLARIGSATLEALTLEQFDTVKSELLALGA